MKIVLLISNEKSKLLYIVLYNVLLCKTECDAKWKHETRFDILQLVKM